MRVMRKSSKKSPARKKVRSKAGKKISRKRAVKKARSAEKVAKRVSPGKKVARAPKVAAISFEGLSLRQIAAKVSDYLEKTGYGPALTGRACAAIHVGALIKPKSLDFVLREYQVNELADAMRAIGFTNTEMNTFESKRCPFSVVFSPPPISVGDDIVDSLQILKTRDGMIRMLDPTDCVRQRLSMFYRWGDREAFDDAIQVATRHPVDLDLVKRWSEWEWCSDRYDEFLARLQKK